MQSSEVLKGKGPDFLPPGSFFTIMHLLLVSSLWKDPLANSYFPDNLPILGASLVFLQR